MVFGREHGLPHFHVWTADCAAVIAIEGLRVLSGSVPPEILAAAKQWAASHKTAILSEWHKLNPGMQR